jgi:CRISPR-associated protein (TIGR03986 family)
MKTGKLIKEGKFWKISSSGQNPMNVYGDFGLTDDMLNQEVEFDTTGGPIKMIRFNGKNYTKKQPIQNNTTRPDYQDNRNNNHDRRVVNHPVAVRVESIGYARAPYNFVPINDLVAKSPLSINEVCFNSYNNDCFSGSISLNIESLTPIYIRGMKSVSDESTAKTADFFKGKDYCIPGSSLRGLLRTMTEIVSYSKMGSINKDTLTKRFHYRAFADQSLSLRDEYVSKMIARERNPNECFYPKVKAGILIKRGKDCFICEGKHYKVEESDALDQGAITQLMSFQTRDRFKANNSYKPDFKRVWFKANTEIIHTNHSKRLKYAKVTDISDVDKVSFKEGYLVCTGWMIGPRERPKGKHMHWVIGDINYSKEIRIPEDVVDNYVNDISRNGMDLISKLKNREIKEVPCFYISDANNKIISFGHTGMFRLAYEKTLIEFFPNGHRHIEKPDFTEMLFGKNDVVPGRVFVEDAFTTNEKLSNQIEIPSIMGSPKPTTFQHYLKQDSSQITAEYNQSDRLSGYRGIKDFNQDTFVNGNKFYWHQSNINYPTKIEIKTDTFRDFLNINGLMNQFKGFPFQSRTEFSLNSLTPEQKKAVVKFNLSQKEAQYTAIKPMLSNAKFKGNIRFENLTKIELGALLFTLNLPENLCLKIGMGKGLGFGSIRLNANVNLSDRNRRYTNLLSEWNGVDVDSTGLSQKEIDEIILAFEQYILSEIKSTNSSLWQEQRVIELKTMLDFNNKISGEKARYMLIRNNEGVNEYKSRPILQQPSDYIEKT